MYNLERGLKIRGFSRKTIGVYLIIRTLDLKYKNLDFRSAQINREFLGSARKDRLYVKIVVKV